MKKKREFNSLFYANSAKVVHNQFIKNHCFPFLVVQNPALLYSMTASKKMKPLYVTLFGKSLVHYQYILTSLFFLLMISLSFFNKVVYYYHKYSYNAIYLDLILEKKIINPLKLGKLQVTVIPCACSFIHEDE